MNPPPPRAELAKAELATLTQLLFHLHAAVGATAPPFPLEELLAPFPSLAAEDQQRLRHCFSTLPPPDDGPGHPGLRRLLGADDEANTITLATSDSLTPRSTTSPPTCQITLSPHLLHDTFVVDLTTTWQAPCLSSLRSAPPQTPQTSLGTCCILYLQLHDPASFSAASAATYLSAVSQRELLICGEATLLGRKIWEFSDGRCPWFVWLDDVAQPIETAFDGSYQQHLVNLLCCRAKIDFAARASRRSFAEGFHIYQAIEAWASQIAPLDSEWPSQDQRMASLEEPLRRLPLLGRDLARCERDIATHRLTLNINAFNAAQAAKALLLEGDTFLKAVLEQDAPTWLRQMDHDLEVLHAGQRYAEQLISALRAIVALDGQQLQRKLAGEEKARNRSLQLTIFFVGAALSFSGLAAATRPRPAARLLAMLTNQQPAASAAGGREGFHAAGLWLGDIAIHFLIGVLAALSLYGLWRLRSKLTRR
ncbi:MAG: hypothetical protein ACK6DG_10525 [Cyanobacteriota bacterium]